MASGPDLFVVCKSCGREVSPVHHRVPVLRQPAAQARAEARARRHAQAAQGAAPAPLAGPAAAGRDPRHPAPTGGPTPRSLLVLAAIVVSIGAPRRRLEPARPRADRQRDRASRGGPSPRCSSTARPATRSSRWRRSSCSAGCWSAATGCGRRCSCSWSAARAACAWPSPRATRLALGGNGAALALLAAWAVRDLLARRRGDRGRRGHARRAGDRGRRRAAPARARRRPAPSPGLGGGLIGLVLGLGLARRLR